MKSTGKTTMPRWAATLFTALVLFAPTDTPVLADGVFEEDAFKDYKGDATNGKYLFAIAGCGTCHAAPESATVLSGGRKFETAIGKFYAPNISAGPNGIGGWTNAQFLNSVMNGNAKKGGTLYPIMPFNSYHGMKPEDVLDIKAYIDTLPPSDAVSVDHELPLISFFSDITYDAEQWKADNLSAAFQQKPKSVVERGRYLAENVAGCGNCHTPHDASLNLDRTRSLTGWTGLTNVTAPDISNSRVAGLPDTDTFLVQFIKEGKKFSGSPIADPHMRGVVDGLREMRPEDQEALYAYLSGKEIKKVDVAKSPTAVCKQKKPAAASNDADPAAKFASSADAFMGRYCRNCHGPGQSAANIYESGDMASIAADKTFVVPGNADASRMFVSIKNGSMPKGGLPPEFGDDLKGLEAWLNALAAGPAPSQVSSAAESARGRPMLASDDFQNAALRDIHNVPEQDRMHQRYFSFREQYNTLFDCEDHETFMKRLPVYSGGFKKLLNSMSFEPELVMPKEVQGTEGLLVRVDLRDLGWTADDYGFLVERYPYGLDPSDAAKVRPVADALGTPLPIMRTDWFVSFAARPEFYNRLMHLPKQISELETKFGVDVNTNIRSLRVARAAFEKNSSGVSDHNRMIERHQIDVGYYWKSYDFAGDGGRQVLNNFPHGPAEIEPLDTGLAAFEHDGGEMIFSLPNGLQGYYLSTNKGDRIDEGPTAIVSHRTRPHGATFGVTVTNARSCFDCHENGIISKRDEMRTFVETSNAFNSDQRELLLAMYVEQTTLDDLYAKDKQRFVEALSRIGVTERNSSGIEQSLRAPGDTEIVTYNADRYDTALDLAAVAGEFDMKPGDFVERAGRISDPTAQHLAAGWINRLKAGRHVERKELEESYGLLVPELLGVKALKQEVKPVVVKKPDPVEKPKTEIADNDTRELFILDVRPSKTNVKVNETLGVEVTASKDCKLQVVYVEADGNVEPFPEEMTGGTLLKAHEKREIPQPGSGRIRFDTPGKDETLVVMCRTDDQADFTLDKEKAIDIAKRFKNNFKRGVAIELDRQVKETPEKKGFYLVTYNVTE